MGLGRVMWSVVIYMACCMCFSGLGGGLRSDDGAGFMELEPRPALCQLRSCSDTSASLQTCEQ